MIKTNKNIFIKSCYSLAELLVAVGIFSVTVLAIASVLRTGSEINITDVHRQRARSIVDSCLESPSYSPQQYGAIAPANAVILIDPRAAGNSDDLTGNLIITVAVDTNKANAAYVEYKRVNVSVQWNEPEGAQSVTMEKYLTSI